jgi:parallel beta-helix repeat protein
VGADSAALKKAADLLAPGDVLSIAPGTYLMDNSLFVPSGVTVRGTSGQTILRKKAGVESALIVDGDYDESQLLVAEPERFAPGMGVTVLDDVLNSSWEPTVTTVTGVDQNVIRISPMTGRDYDVASHHAKIRNTFPILCAINTHDVLIENVIVDGDGSENAYIDGCRGGAIYAFQSKNTTIKNCVARNYNGDGISFQVTDNTRVLNCESYGNSGFGIHPGTGANRPLVAECLIHHNGQVGLFLCWRVKHGSFERNEIADNGKYGISIGHKDTDNLFVGNRVSGNGLCGVYFREETPVNSGNRNTFRANTVMDNGGAEKGYGFYIEPHAGEITIVDNRIGYTHSGIAKTQRIGVFKAQGAGGIKLDGNAFEGEGQKDYVEAGAGQKGE